MTGKSLATVHHARATGAVILCHSQAVADHINRLADQLGLTVTVRVVEPRIYGRSAHMMLTDTEYDT
jgi:hypothetical protein